MAGGLLQIASFGSQDIFLTGNPEITFFKTVYRRHTNFSVESIEVQFEDPVDFDQTCAAVLPYSGDLVTKIYLKIDLPQLNFKRVHTPSDSYLTEYTTAKNNYHTVQDYVKVMMDGYRLAYADAEASNVIYAETLYDSIEGYFTAGNGYSSEINEYALLTHTHTEDSTNIRTIASEYAPSSSSSGGSSSSTSSGGSSALKAELMDKLNKAVIRLQKELKSFFYEMLSKKRAYEDDISLNIKIAWVDKIGHSLLNYVQISIGGAKIDKHYGEWLTIWSELTEKYYTETLFKKMIGDVSELTSFNRVAKESYTLFVPLQFWFCRTNGLALPLIALQYTDITIEVNFRKFKDVVYIAQDEIILVGDEEYTLGEITDTEGGVLQASLLIDYIFLDSNERRRFAQSSHEYLIEQVQTIEYKTVSSTRFNMHLDFFHPTKEIIWTAQKDSYRDNPDGYTKTNFDKFSSTQTLIESVDPYTGEITTSISYTGDTITDSTLEFNGHTRVPLFSSTYYQSVQSYQHHTRTPSDGVSVYSFALAPEEQQPSGHTDMSRLSKVQLSLEFDPTVISSDTLNVRGYALSLNILRFIGGMAGLAYIS